MANGTVAKVGAKPKGENIFARFAKFVKESYIETRYKSAWPTWPELRQFTLIVIFALVITSIWIGGLDSILSIITRDILGQ